MAVTINAKGTSESAFSIGKQGPKLKNNASVVEIRNSTDSAFAELRALTGTTNDGLTTKQYVDSVASGLNTKNSVRAITNGASDLTGFTYTAASDNETVGAAPWTLVVTPTFDGVSLANGDRVLIKDSTDAKGNGIFTFDSGASTFVRATDADNSPSNEVSGGMFAFVGEGTLFADTGWTLSSPTGAATLGTSNLDFTQFSSAGVVTGGNGLVKNGLALDVVGTANRISVSVDAIDIASTYVGQTSITTLGTIANFSSTGIDDNASATRLTISDSANTLIAANGSGGVGGSVDFTGGDGAATFAGGAVTLTGGTGGSSNAGGAITLTSGTGGTTNGSGGVITLLTGDGPNNGGAINITTGATSGSGGVGGAVSITTGNGGGNSGAGGAINITSGNAGGALSSSNGGAITLTSGTGGSGTGAGGDIVLAPGIAGTGGSAADGIVNISTANLGIGTSTPVARLQVSDNTTAVSLVRIDTNQNADITVLRAGNISNGNAARTRIQLNNNFANSYLIMNGNSTVDTGAFGTNGLTIQNDGTGGIRLAASHVSGGIKFFTAGTSGANERMSIGSTGIVTLTNNILTDNGTVSLPAYSFSGDTNTGMWHEGVDRLSFATGGINHMSIDSTGAIEMGNSGSTGISAKFGKNTSNVNYIEFGGGITTVSPTIDARGTDLNVGLSVATKGTGELKLSTNSTTAITVDSNGDVGIGSSSGATAPGAKLVVADNSALEFRLLHEGNGTTVLRRNGTISYLLTEGSTAANRQLAFGSQSSPGGAITEHMRVFDTGDVAIGTTVVGSKFHVKDATANTIAEFSRDTGFGDSVQDCGIVIGNSGVNEGKLQLRYFNHTTTAASQLATIDFLPRNAADTGSKVAGRIIFTTDPDSSAEVQLSAPNNGGTAMIATLDGDDQVWAPLTSGQLGLGRTAKRWSSLWLSQSSTSAAAATVLTSSASFTGAVLKTDTNTVAGSGFNHILSTSDVDGTPDPVFRVQGNGLVFADGAYSGAGADYADYFEWEDGNPDNKDRVGYSVVLTKSGKIRIAQKGENPIGVISGRPSVAGNAATDSWADKFLKDEYHRYILDDDNAKIVNPNYDPDADYIPRPDRPEWDAVGLVGRLPVEKDQVVSSSWTKIKDISVDVEEWLVTGGATEMVVTTAIESVIHDVTETEETEETATAAKLQELSNLFYTRLSEGFVWKKETFDIDERAQHNIGTEFMFQAQSVDDFPNDFSWRGYQNQEVAMDYHQFMNFAKASRTHIKKMREAKAVHEKSINRKRLVRSIMECDISKGWPKSAAESLSKKKKK